MFKKIDKSEAKELLNKALFEILFHDPEWQEFLEKGFKWLRFGHYLYKDELLVSFAGVKVFGREKLISLPFCEYGGPLPLKEGVNFEEFKRDVLNEFGNNIKIKFHPAVLKYFKYPTFNIQHPTPNISTYFIENLNNLNEENLLKSFRKTLRHSIRNAQNQGLEIKRCKDLKELKRFYNLYVANLKKKKTVPYPFSVIKYLYQNPATEVLLALYKNKIIAGSLFLEYSGFVHYFLSASDYKYRNLGANYLILWEKIKNSCGQNKIFDLGVAPKGSPLEIFKRGWGGKEYPILQLGIKRSEESLRSSKLRKIWGLLPNFIVKKLSPYLIKYRL